jgi:hypothetical protein
MRSVPLVSLAEGIIDGGELSTVPDNRCDVKSIRRMGWFKYM